MPSPKFHPVPDDLCGTPAGQEELEREKQYILEMRQRYQNVFGTGEGKVVLGDILTSCHFGETLNPDSPVQVAEYNVGLAILRSTGMLEEFCLELRIGR